ncbi:hypothetical protein CEB3_c03160 [Peptococcaceae bacterium CEB3]|nr:hypothetical protein CEB3_c03160 [Peptococcaceae bacterium CEB3]
MKIHLPSFLDTRKKKAGAILLSGVLITALGTGAAYAANATNAGQSLMAKVQKNGVASYSTDGGQTWSQNAPAGVTKTIGPDGQVTLTNGNKPQGHGEGHGLLARVQDGVTTYSTDGGNTWSQNAPAGVTTGPDGHVTISNGN